jgi:3-hydroxy acid dehydrogenase / malonic semialdehyde reductase
MTKTVFISGATSGIGKACAEKFAGAGCSLILSGRRAERLENIKAALEKKYKISVFILCFDIQKREDVFTAVTKLPPEITNIDILINNAGLALGRDAFDKAEIDDWETMMHTNVDGILFLTRALMPLLKKAKGHIINLGSVAGKGIYENGSVYCASKFAVDALSKGMRIDLLKYGMKVTSINPGAVETEFSVVRFKGNKEMADAAYKNLIPLTPEDVAETIFYCANLPAHVCINDLSITCLQQADAVYFYKDNFVE